MTKEQIKQKFDDARAALALSGLDIATEFLDMWEFAYSNGAHEPFDEAFLDGFAIAIYLMRKL